MWTPGILRIQDDQQHRGLDFTFFVCYFYGAIFNGHLIFFLFWGSLGVPYHSWRITHAKHHASTGHMMQDQVFVPSTRSDLGLPPLNPAKEDLLGSRVSAEVKKELWEALGDSPIGAVLGAASYLVGSRR
jgi:omega-6 fatty acid desaturase / acyl-lipid omega-6 desaturase (Delta-12 desaturase)